MSQIQDSSLVKAIFAKDEYTSDIDEWVPEKKLHDSKPMHKKNKENSKYDTSIQRKKFECSFGNVNLENTLQRQYNTIDNSKPVTSKLSQMLIKWAQNSKVPSDHSSSMTPVEEDVVPQPMSNPKVKKKPKYNSSKPVFEKVLHKNEWSTYGSSFAEFPSHLFKPPAQASTGEMTLGSFSKSSVFRR